MTTMETKLEWLETLVEDLCLVQEGIQELDGVTTEIYQNAKYRLERRTAVVRHKRLCDREKAEIQEKINQLQAELAKYG